MVDTRGVEKWISGQGIPFRHEDGSIVWNQVLTDIAKLKETEKELRRANERFELAARADQLGVWEYNVETDELVWDDTMLEMFPIHLTRTQSLKSPPHNQYLSKTYFTTQRDVNLIDHQYFTLLCLCEKPLYANAERNKTTLRFQRFSHTRKISIFEKHIP